MHPSLVWAARARVAPRHLLHVRRDGAGSDGGSSRTRLGCALRVICRQPAPEWHAAGGALGACPHKHETAGWSSQRRRGCGIVPSASDRAGSCFSSVRVDVLVFGAVRRHRVCNKTCAVRFSFATRLMTRAQASRAARSPAPPRPRRAPQPQEAARRAVREARRAAPPAWARRGATRRGSHA